MIVSGNTLEGGGVFTAGARKRAKNRTLLLQRCLRNNQQIKGSVSHLFSFSPRLTSIFVAFGRVIASSGSQGGANW